MSEIYSRTTEQSFGSNLMESIKSFLGGVILFLGSFALLYWNEGRTDMSEVAKTAVVVKADAPGTTGEGKLIAVTSNLTIDESVGDPEMLVPGQYVKLHRKAEMYAWTEKYDKKVEKKLGGGSVTKETVEYTKKWTENPPNSDSFKVPAGHRNPKASVQSQNFYASKAKVGAFTFSPKDADGKGADGGSLEGSGLPAATDVTLTAAMVKSFGGGSPGPKAPPPKPGPPAKPTTPTKGKAAASGSAAAPAASGSAAPDGDDSDTASPPPGGPFKLVGGYLFRGFTTPDQGEDNSASKKGVGDMRVSFQAVLPGKQVTLYGKRTGTQVAMFTTSDNDNFLRVVEGTHEQAIAKMHGEHVMLTWIFRLVGFICMWSGLGMILSPINAVLDIVPIIGSAGRLVTSIAMFPVALVLSIVTILVSIVAHNIILLFVVMLVVVGGITAFIMIRRKNAPPKQTVPVPAGGMPPMGYQGGPPQGGPPQGYGGPPQGGYGPPPGGGGYGPPPGGGGYGPPPGGGGYGPPPGGGGYGPPGGGGYGPPPGGGGPPPGGGGYGDPPPGGGGYGGPPPGGG